MAYQIPDGLTNSTKDYNSNYIMTPAEIARLIDHALLHPTLTDKDLKDGCLLAVKYETASVCIKPYAVKQAAEWVKNSGVMVSTVIGFPHGGNSIAQKLSESKQAVADGAVELDMVINVGKVLSEDWQYVQEELQTIQSVMNEQRIILKVIFETDFLSTDDKIKLCGICNDVKVGFVKTSTGFGFVKQQDNCFQTAGATTEDIELMRKYCDPQIQVKASGGIRTLSDVLRMVKSGATRIGTGSTKIIMEEALQLPSNSNTTNGETEKNTY
jgi:deoxyribose-phosphate aldolase